MDQRLPGFEHSLFPNFILTPNIVNLVPSLCVRKFSPYILLSSHIYENDSQI